MTKEGLAARVVDRQQVHRTISKEEMLHLFEFGEEENFDTLMELSEENGNQNMANDVGKSLNSKIPLSHGSCSTDKVMESLLSKHHPRYCQSVFVYWFQLLLARNRYSPFFLVQLCSFSF